MSHFKSLCLKISGFYKKHRKYFGFKSFPLLVHELTAGKNRVLKDYSFERKFVADLIMQVLTAKLCVREALLKFPKNADDISLKIAWHALVHFEADEDISNRDYNYKSVQVDFLEMIYNGLKEGEELPQNLITDYNIYYKDVAISKKSGLRGIWEKLTRNINI